MSQIDEELKRGCQRYLDELEKRSQVLEKKKEEQRQAEEQKSKRREYWRKMLYETEGQGLTVVVPDDSKLNRKDAE